MAKAKKYRNVQVKKGTKRNRGRWCVAARAPAGAKKPFKKASDKRFFGCFKSKAKAVTRKNSVEKRKNAK